MSILYIKPRMLVSIIMPYFKKKKYVKYSVLSALNQTFKNFELIIIYDNETSDELKFINKIKKLDKRIKVIKNKFNIGAGLSRNIGIDHSKGFYLAFLDADDLWDKNKLFTQIKFMRKKNIEISHTSYEIIDDNSVIKGTRQAKSMNYNKLIKSCDIGLSTVIIKKSLIKNLKFPNLKTKEDYVLWLEITKKGKIIHALNKKLTQWRKSNNSLSSSVVRKLTDGYYVYRYFLKYNVVKSLYSLLLLSINFLKKTK
ncbi:glycosyltransferase [Candidatus Pelagibacter sp.]|nr:glycosyltransferase [Candidatus Pelagibacter sp.]